MATAAIRPGSTSNRTDHVMDLGRQKIVVVPLRLHQHALGDEILTEHGFAEMVSRSDVPFV